MLMGGTPYMAAAIVVLSTKFASGQAVVCILRVNGPSFAQQVHPLRPVNQQMRPNEVNVLRLQSLSNCIFEARRRDSTASCRPH
ncbi:hypothetical protein PYCCODRAFT_331436 [Trametes coccinea BRFM310]|uniref:Secreted protein n=1 Tax=Trametes coccinea (strain BRFM310) TaxID=1353009 RepID=A0A1Y2INH1_TRAC3|nr:hypothetical protein PYCCODRAFT_331436 [Trametes coccinea BRFM310]